MLLTDVTRGPAGNDERMGFLYDTRRVKPSGLACELVVPPERDDIQEGAFGRQFARIPYACSFYGAGDTFILVTLHVLYGQSPTQRVGELPAIARWLAEWASNVNAYHHNLIALGDFNIDRKDDPLYQAFTSTGLTVPAALHACRGRFRVLHRPPLRPNRLVRHRHRQDPEAVAAPYRRGRHLQLRWPGPPAADPPAGVLARVRPSPALGRVRALVGIASGASVTCRRRLRCTASARWPARAI